MAAIMALARSRPLAFGMGYSLLKTAGCDLMVQKIVEKRENIDWKRNLAFGTFGFFYLGGIQYAIYVPLFSRLFPGAASFAAKSVADKLKDPKGIRELFYQVFLDQCVHHPFLYFPVFYMIKDFVTSETPNPVAAVEEYSSNMNEDLIALWKIWVPSTFLNFALMPMHLRIPWVATTSLIWTCILSSMRGVHHVPSNATRSRARACFADGVCARPCCHLAGSSDVPVTNVFAGVDASTFALATRTVVGPPPRLDPTRGHLVVFVRGADRPGIVASLAKRCYEQEGSITTSKMMSLGNEFVIILHVSCPREKLSSLQKALCPAKSALAGQWYTGEDGMSISMSVLDASVAPPPAPAFTGKVSLTGIDKPGLIYNLSQTLADHHLSIEHLQTEQHLSEGVGPAFFSTMCYVVGSSQPDMPALKRSLKDLEAKLGVMCSVEALEVKRRGR